jgi:hypothetical protein
MQIQNTSNSTSGSGLLIQAGADSSYPAKYIQFVYGTTPNTGGAITQTNPTTTNYGSASDARLKENIRDTEKGLSVLEKIRVVDYTAIGDTTGTVMQGFLAQELQPLYEHAVFSPNTHVPRSYVPEKFRPTTKAELTVDEAKAESEHEAAWAADEPARKAAWEAQEAQHKADSENPFKNPMNVDYGKLTPLLTKSVQELSAQVKSQAKSIEMLMDRLTNLEASVSSKK